MQKSVYDLVYQDNILYRGSVFSFVRAKRTNILATVVSGIGLREGTTYNLRIPYDKMFNMSDSKEVAKLPTPKKSNKRFVSVRDVPKGKLFMFEHAGKPCVYKMIGIKRTRFEVENPITNQVATMSGTFDAIVL